MSKRLRDAELMGEDIIDTYLSEEPLCESNHPTESDEPKLRRFVVDGRESLQRPRLIGKGLHGVAILATIKGDEYVLKVVSSDHDLCCVLLSSLSLFSTPGLADT